MVNTMTEDYTAAEAQSFAKQFKCLNHMWDKIARYENTLASLVVMELQGDNGWSYLRMCKE